MRLTTRLFTSRSMPHKPIQVFNRHCGFSTVSQYKQNPPWFSREKCFRNLVSTANPDLVDINIIFDNARGEYGNHFLGQSNYTPHIITDGSEAGAFIKLLDHISSFGFEHNTIIYIVEDDYLHRPNWASVVIEGTKIISERIGEGFGSLYDHPDKMEPSIYPQLYSQIFCSKTTHWRTTPSTTNTYFGQYSAFQDSMEIQKAFSTGVSISRDHDKFISLLQNGYGLITPVPGYSTHCVEGYLGTITDWSKLSIND